MSNTTIPVVKAAKPAPAPLSLDWARVANARIETRRVGIKPVAQRKGEDGNDYAVRLAKQEDGIARRAARVAETLTKAGAPAEQVSEAESLALCYRAVPTLVLGRVAVPANGRLGRALSLLAARASE